MTLPFNFLDKFDLVGSTTHQIYLTGVLLLCWTLFFLAVNRLVKLPNMTAKQANDTKNRIVSIVHGLLTLLMSIYVFYFSQ